MSVAIIYLRNKSFMYDDCTGKVKLSYSEIEYTNRRALGANFIT